MKMRMVLAAAALLVLSLMVASPASAQYTGGQAPKAGPTAGPVVKVQAPVAPARVQAGRAAQQRRAVAVTGADIAQMVLIGGAFVVGGVILVRQSRRRVTSTAS